MIKPVVEVRQALQIFLLGAIGFNGSAMLDFTGLNYIPVSIERLILFLYPTFVVIISLLIRPAEIAVAAVFYKQSARIGAEMFKGMKMVFTVAILCAVYSVASMKRSGHSVR